MTRIRLPVHARRAIEAYQAADEATILALARVRRWDPAANRVRWFNSSEGEAYQRIWALWRSLPDVAARYATVTRACQRASLDHASGPLALIDRHDAWPPALQAADLELQSVVIAACLTAWLPAGKLVVRNLDDLAWLRKAWRAVGLPLD